MQRKEPFNQKMRNEKTIVHPTKHQYVHTSSESVVNHIHPVHTTYVHHHSPKNQHQGLYGVQPFFEGQRMGARPPFQSPPMSIAPPGQMHRQMRNHPGLPPLGRPRRPRPW